MAWLTKRGNVFHLGFRYSGRVFRTSLKTTDRRKAKTVTLREKKRNRHKYTTRTVPLTSVLCDALDNWFANHPGGRTAFCAGGIARSPIARERPEPLTVDHLKRTFSGAKWTKVRGWHVLRHSFASNCAARRVDQRIINSWMGHQTEEMMKRYQHLFPDSQQQAIRSVFEG